MVTFDVLSREVRVCVCVQSGIRLLGLCCWADVQCRTEVTQSEQKVLHTEDMSTWILPIFA